MKLSPWIAPSILSADFARLGDEVNAVLALPDVRSRFDQLGIEIEGGPPSRYAELLKSEVARLARLVKAGALQVE